MRSSSRPSSNSLADSSPELTSPSSALPLPPAFLPLPAFSAGVLAFLTAPRFLRPPPSSSSSSLSSSSSEDFFLLCFRSLILTLSLTFFSGSLSSSCDEDRADDEIGEDDREDLEPADLKTQHTV